MKISSTRTNQITFSQSLNETKFEQASLQLYFQEAIPVVRFLNLYTGKVIIIIIIKSLE